MTEVIRLQIITHVTNLSQASLNSFTFFCGIGCLNLQKTDKHDVQWNNNADRK